MKSNQSLIKLIRKIKVPKKLIIFSVVISIIASALELTIPLFTQNLIDNFEKIIKDKVYIFIFITIFIFSSILNGISIYLLTKIGESIIYSLIERIWNHISNLPLSFFDKNSAGEILSRIIDDTSIINNYITQTIPRVFPSLITLIGSLVILFLLDWKITLASMITFPIYIIVIMIMSDIVKKLSYETQLEIAKLSGKITNIISEIKLVKMSRSERSENSNINSILTNIYNLGLKGGIVNALVAPFNNMLMLISIGLVLGYGGYRVSTESISIGTLIAIIFYIMQLTDPIENISEIFTGYKKTEGVSIRLKEIMDIEKENISHIDNREYTSQYDLSFDKVTFSYDGIHNVLKEVSFSIPSNKVTALVGPSGSGKTTIFNIIARLYSIDSGNIKYGNESIYKIPLSEWRGNLGYVMQNNGIINGTIKENLIYASDGYISNDQMKYYSKLANIHSFISRLEKGYNTLIGESGIELSGGEKQRIDIARNLIKKPNLLLLDEATSSLDSESEEIIQKSIKYISSQSTTLIIAHRLSTILQADQILFIEDGKVTGKGTHEELLEQHQKYKHMIKLQGLK